jgi:hypothetical protein
VTGATGLGGWPQDDPLTAAQQVLDELTTVGDGVEGLPFVVRPAGRAELDDPGRDLALLVELPAELGPHGWALSDRPGRDRDRALSAVRQELDALAVAAHGYVGPLVVPVLGPLSLAAQVWLARGDRAVGDHGALAEIAASQAVGLAELLAALGRAVPGAVPWVLLREPLLAVAVAGGLATFSGHDRLRAVPAPVATERVRTVVDAVRSAGAGQVVVHVGSARAALAVARSTGADGVGIELAGLGAAGWERLAEQVEQGVRLWAQPVAGGPGLGGADLAALAATVAAPWARVGLPAAGLAQVVLVGPDLAAATGSAPARQALAAVVGAARVLAEAASG